MSKLKIASLVSTALLALPVAAFASVNVQDIGTLVNDTTSTTVDAGSQFDLTFTADATSGDEIEYVRTRTRDQNNHILSTSCTNVGRVTGDDVEMTAQATTPSDTPQGNIDVLVDVYGNPGVSQHDGCNGSSIGNRTFDDIVRVGDNTSSGHSNNSVGGFLTSQLQKQIADLLKMIADLKNPPAPAKPAGCDGVVAYNGYNAWAAQASLFAVDAGKAVFNMNGVYAPTGNFKSISGQAAAAVAVACK